MMNKGAGFGRITSGLILGGLLGAAGALLLAPQSGRKTRRQIRDEGFEIKDQVEQMVADARHNARQVTHDAQRKIEDLQQRGQDLLMPKKLQTFKEKTNDTVRHS